MRFLRPGHLAIAFTAFFALVGYFAHETAQRTTSPWFPPPISQTVYQTTMVGGVLVLAVLLLTAAILPHVVRSAASRPLSIAPSRSGRSNRLSAAGYATRPLRPARPSDPRWTVEDFLDDSEVRASGYEDRASFPTPVAVATALSRVRAGTVSSRAQTLMDRLSEIRARDSVVSVNERRGNEQVLLRLVTEMKPLLIAAREAGLDVPEIRRLVTEATAGHEEDLAYRVRLVEQMKGTLESAIAERVGEELRSVLGDIEQAKTATRQVHDAELVAAEALALLDTRNYAAAFDRAVRARQTFESQRLMPNRMDWAPGATTFAAFIGPSILATAYVSIAAMLLPGVEGFLQTNFVLNTTVILFISYSWLGMILYALTSIYVASRLRPARGESSRDRPDGEW